jgi:excisionase family DNA binding protein
MLKPTPSSTPAGTPAPLRLALSKAEAAEALGVSVDFLDAHVMDELRIVRRGRRRLIPVCELERWLTDNAARTLAA